MSESKLPVPRKNNVLIQVVEEVYKPQGRVAVPQGQELKKISNGLLMGTVVAAGPLVENTSDNALVYFNRHDMEVLLFSQDNETSTSIYILSEDKILANQL